MTLTLVIAGLVGLCVGGMLGVAIGRARVATPGGVVAARRPDAPEGPAGGPFAPGHRPSGFTRWWKAVSSPGTAIAVSRGPRWGNPFFRRLAAVALAGALAAVASIAGFGVTWQALPATVFLCALIVLSAIDLECQILPNVIVLPMLWLGLGASCLTTFAAPDEAILGAASGYASLWTIFHAYRALTGKDALGRGDFKLMAMIGAWLGIDAVPIVLMVAFPLGAVLGLGLMGLGRARLGAALPFGPMLAAGAAAALFGEKEIYQFLLILAV